MPGDSLFSRSNQESGGTDDAEGVRIIDADAAAEAVERGDTAKRKADDQPKYGDRPPPPDGPRPRGLTHIELRRSHADSR